METKISLEVAEKEWISFLEDNDATSLIPDEDLKNSKDKTDRETYRNQKTNYEKIIRAISHGLVVIEDGVVSQTLQYPIKSTEGKILFDILVYNQRWNAKDREEIFKGMDSDDSSTAMAAQRKLCSKITGVDAMILQRLDSVDLKVTDQIVSVFFM
jgi:hypothetical protein